MSAPTDPFLELENLFVAAVGRYRAGGCDVTHFFTNDEQACLQSVGQTPQEMYDFVEDHARRGEPTWETVLAISATRHEYLQTVQNGLSSAKKLTMSDLPPKNAELDGIPWLPRVIKKAEAKLRGELPPDAMYCCSGDLNFFQKHGLTPGDFLRQVWAANGDEQKILDYVRDAKQAS